MWFKFCTNYVAERLRHRSCEQTVPILAIFLSTTFYDSKVIFGYIREGPENFMSKYTQEV